MLKIHTRSRGAVTVFCLQGRIVNGETATLREAVYSQSQASVLVLDLTQVTTVDASGLGLMLELRKQAESRGARFKLINASRFVRRVLEITRLDSVFEITSVVELSPTVARPRSAGAIQFAACG